MHKKVIMRLTLLLIIVISVSAVTVYAADDDLYKNLEETAQQSKDDYFIKYRDHYGIDTEEMSIFKDTGSVVFKNLYSFNFFLQKLLATLTIAVFSFSLSADISPIFAEIIEPFIIAMKSSLWDSLAVYAIAFAAFLLLLKMAQRRMIQALSSFIGIVLIVVMAFIFYAYPIQMLKAVDTVTCGVSDAVMEGPYKTTVGGNASDAKGKASSLCWNLFVHKSWQVLEFGNISTAKKYEADILKLEPDSEERKELIKQLAESEGLFSKSFGYQLSRLATSVILFLFNILLMAVILIFAVLIIGFRLLLLVYLLLGVFVFLASLLPNFGLILVQRWGMRIVSISFTRVIIVFFLSVTLILMDVIYKFVDEYGLLIIMFLMFVATVALWLERHRILELFYMYNSTGGQMPQMLNKGIEADWNIMSAARTTKQKVQNQDFNQIGEKLKVPGQYLKTKGEQLIAFKDSKVEQAGNFRQNVKENVVSSKEVLENQYSYLKSKAGAYDSFVNRTEKVRASGAGNFDTKDIIKMTQLMNRINKQGLSTNDIVYDGKDFSLRTEEKVKRPQSLGSVTMEKAADLAGKVRTPKKVKLEEYKTTFGEEKGEELYYNMVEKYGKGVVDSVSPSVEQNNQKGKDTISKTKVEKDKKLNYAEVIKQLQKKSEEQKQKKQPESVKLRKGDKQHGKQ
ncbi:CD3337/EF1877 family mobilome membrane protein [Aminipila sp.]|uniref:CD3337/EF1877 family mobilome membrane protein n=1 Tax=Aminipila sp. TaxID=2060095 RepID=UPI00289E147E|nr:hypothetical protein [Aminipila sp.]